jgi:exodeoxyribonuclease VII large subunit
MTDDEPLTVSQLTAAVKGCLEGEFAGTRVAGEVTNLVRAASGHVYFSLKDAGAVLRCVMWRGFALRLKFDLRDGQQVIARGGLTVYPQRGEYQLVCESLEPKGIGAAELALRQLKENLLQRGYFAPARKRPLPLFPRCVALIASPTGAAVRDMLEVLAHRWPLARVVVKASRVQGDGAAAEIAAAVALLNRLHKLDHLPLCAIVIGRGGGSAEDLAAFNEECVADAVYASAVPVVSAVGHEIDVSICDLVADYRALTPSQAIAALCPDRTELYDGLREREDRMREAVQHRVALGRRHLDQLAARPAFRKPLDRVRTLEQKLDDTAARLLRVARLGVARRADKLAAASDQLQGLSPLNVLGRGYSLTRKRGASGLLRDAADVKPGDTIVTRLATGEVESVVAAPGS